MDEAAGRRLKKAFLYALIGSVGLGALLGILAISSGPLRWFELRILLTTATIAGASLCGLACGAYLATQRGRVLPFAGIALTLVSAVMLLAAIWLEVRPGKFLRIAATLAVFAVACAHLSLLSMARLAEWCQWALAAAYAAVFWVASLLAMLIMDQGFGPDKFQLLGVAAIVDAAVTMAIPILHRLSKDEVAAESARKSAGGPAEIDAELAALRERMAELERLKQQGR